MSKQRYERRTTEPATDQNDTDGVEIVTGVPITPATAPGSPQYATFEEAATKVAADASRVADSGPMEDRDNRGGDDIDGEGKTKTRLPIHEVDAMAEEMAGGFSRDVQNVNTSLDGNSMTVTITTKHGTSRATADVADWTKAGVKKALDEIKGKMTGETPSEGNQPKDRLAAAIRDVAAQG